MPADFLHEDRPDGDQRAISHTEFRRYEPTRLGAL
jgi:hypothetical protein